MAQSAGDPTCTTLLAEVLATLTERRDLSEMQMQGMMRGLLGGRFEEAEVAAFLMALRMKEETAAEIAVAATVLREHMVRLPGIHNRVLDTCGTGGDETGTFNISTAVALVVAGAGVPVVKHGNRAVSSRSGSADVLAELGVAVEGGVHWAKRCLAEAGLAFCFAPHFHPALARVAGVRRRLRVRTLFNCLGPLVNPSGAPYQLLGVGGVAWLDRLAAALAILGTRHAILVCSRDRLDEVSLSAPTMVREVVGGKILAQEWTHADFGLEPCSLTDLRVEGPAESAAMIRAVLNGVAGPPFRVVLANAAAALLAAERVQDLPQGVQLARESLYSGRARQVLDRLVACVPEAWAQGQAQD